MFKVSPKKVIQLDPDQRNRVYARIKQGAIFRAGAGLLILGFVVAGYLAGITRVPHIIGISACLIFLIAASIPMLAILKMSQSRRIYEFTSIGNNLCEVVGYTAIIYFLGGTRALFISPLYAALIAYLGVVTPPRFLFITVALSVVSLSIAVALEYYGIIPSMDPFSTPPLPGPAQIIMVLALGCLLFAIAFITSITGKQLNKSRRRQQTQYIELEKRAKKIELTEMDLRQAHQGLEKRVEERTSELREANLRLQDEIKERQRLEGELRESNASLQTLIQTSPVAINVLEPDGKVRLWNQAAERIFGWRETEIIGRLLPYVPEDKQEEYRALRERVLRGDGFTGVEVQRRKKDGSPIDISVSTAPLRDVNGNITGIMSVNIDITEQKRAEEERQKLESQMREVQKLESLGVLAGGIAHDFNNLLMAILGNADLALLSLKPDSPARPNVEDISRASKRAAELCRQMLAYSGKGRFVVGRHDLSEIVREVTQMLEVSVSKKASLRYALPEGLPAVEADVTQIHQVIMNLITNASESLGEATGLISVSCGVMECNRAYLSEGYWDDRLPEGKYIYLDVSDTGCGMNAETLRRIFDPFFTTKFTGRGLGLAAVLGIVRGHKGTIKVDSRPGQGTTFKILLPAAEWTSNDRQQRVGQNPSPRNGVVLLIDDDPVVREVGTQMLAHLDFQVLTANDGRKGVDLFEARRGEIDCIILDLTMPEMDGEEAFQALRCLQNDVRVILSSGYNEQDVIQQFAGQGLAGFIQKPYTVAKLRETLNRVLG